MSATDFTALEFFFWWHSHVSVLRKVRVLVPIISFGCNRRNNKSSLRLPLLLVPFLEHLLYTRHCTNEIIYNALNPHTFLSELTLSPSLFPNANIKASLNGERTKSKIFVTLILSCYLLASGLYIRVRHNQW